MLDGRGARVIEFNARFGDPETQAIVPLLGGSFAELLAGAARGALDAAVVSRLPGAAVTLALVDDGYPQAVRGGGSIEGLEELEAAAGGGVTVFHAGTRFEDGRWTVRGGRAAYLMAMDATIEAARERVYATRRRLGGSGWRCRGDIAATVAGAVAPAGGISA
jgi:phosphoribosylamine--glycine ligase